MTEEELKKKIFYTEQFIIGLSERMKHVSVMTDESLLRRFPMLESESGLPATEYLPESYKEEYNEIVKQWYEQQGELQAKLFDDLIALKAQLSSMKDKG